VYIVNTHSSEPAWFDFKAVLNPTGAEKRATVTSDGW
jgi:hypothetical protein